ncbi:MAG: MFS transporter [Armatimonadetes bacterium]|nr:MFS transporter [Armatimonadota bacterium]
MIPLKAREPSLFGVFLTVFLDMVSFGMFIPDLQLRGLNLAANYLGIPPTSHSTQLGLMVGLSLGIFSLAQLLVSPWMGRISDTHGRKKVLLLSAIVNLIAYVIYGHATAFWIVVIARALGGVGASNLGVAFAYVADVTTPENRAKGMGMVGAAFGLGFIIGPALGAYLLTVGNDNPLVLGYAGAFLIFLNILYIQFGLVESYSPVATSGKVSLLKDFRVAFGTPGLRLLLVMTFVLTLGFTNLETTFFQLLSDPRSVFHLGITAKTTGGIILTYVGIIAVITQGFLLRRLTPKYGEVNLARFGLLCVVPALALVPFAPLWAAAIPVITMMGFGNGIAQPSLSSLVSRSAPRTMQGGIFGITQSLGAFARFLGPVVSGPLFRWQPSAPYILGAVITLIPAIAAWKLRQPAPFSEAGNEA